MENNFKNYDIAEIPEDSDEKIRALEQDICHKTGKDIVLVAYQVSK